MNGKKRDDWRKRKAKELYQELDAFFQPAQYEDLAANGLLADHTEWIEKVYTATFSGRQVIEKLRGSRGGKLSAAVYSSSSAQHPEGLPAENFSDEGQGVYAEEGESAIIVFIFHWTRSVRILPASVWPERWASFLIILSSKRAVPSWGCIAVRNGKRQQMSGWKQKS